MIARFFDYMPMPRNTLRETNILVAPEKYSPGPTRTFHFPSIRFQVLLLLVWGRVFWGAFFIWDSKQPDITNGQVSAIERYVPFCRELPGGHFIRHGEGEAFPLSGHGFQATIPLFWKANAWHELLNFLLNPPCGTLRFVFTADIRNTRAIESSGLKCGHCFRCL